MTTPAKRRWPLWLTLLPLIVGIGAYWLVWRGFADRFASDIHTVLPQAASDVGGFPYRLEDQLTAPVLRHDSPGLRASASADLAVLNRGPWQPDLTVLALKQPRLNIAVPPLAGATLALAAPVGSASLRLDSQRGATRLARLSTHFDNATLAVGLLPTPIAADSIELHLREITLAKPDGASPTPAPVAQFVLKASGARYGGGDALALTADFTANAATLIRSYAGWAPRGTIELTTLTLTDANGEVLRASGTAVPQAGHLAIAGTITTVCPQMLRAAVTGTPARPEKRLRAPVRMALTVQGGVTTLGDPGGGWASRPVRGQLPPCPVLRR